MKPVFYAAWPLRMHVMNGILPQPKIGGTETPSGEAYFGLEGLLHRAVVPALDTPCQVTRRRIHQVQNPARARPRPR